MKCKQRCAGLVVQEHSMNGISVRFKAVAQLPSNRSRCLKKADSPPPNRDPSEEDCCGLGRGCHKQFLGGRPPSIPSQVSVHGAVNACQEALPTGAAHLSCLDCQRRGGSGFQPSLFRRGCSGRRSSHTAGALPPTSAE